MFYHLQALRCLEGKEAQVQFVVIQFLLTAKADFKTRIHDFVREVRISVLFVPAKFCMCECLQSCQDKISELNLVTPLAVQQFFNKLNITSVL